MAQKFNSKAQISEEPYTLYITYHIYAIVRNRGLLKGEFIGQGTGTNITAELDKLNAVIKCFDTAWNQFMTHYNLFGETNLILSRKLKPVNYDIVYKGYGRTFEVTTRKRRYIVTRNAKGQYKKFTRYEAVGIQDIRENSKEVVIEQLDIYQGINTDITTRKR